MGLGGGKAWAVKQPSVLSKDPWSSPATQWSRAVMMAAWGLQWELHPVWHLRPGLNPYLLTSVFLIILHHPTTAKSTAPATCGAVFYHLWVPKALFPVPSSRRSHTPQTCHCLGYLTCSFFSWHANHYYLSLTLPSRVQKLLKASLSFLNSPGQVGVT